MSKKSMKPGGGGRFAKLKGKLAKEGVDDPDALAASIGRKKYGKKKFQKFAAQGKSSPSAADQAAALRNR